MSGAPDPKPRRRLVLPPASYRSLVKTMLLRHRDCELCGKRRSESAHHTVAKGQGGDDVAENLTMLCGSGTTGCHGEVEHGREARSRLRRKLRAEVVAYVIERKGHAWLNRRYPEAL